MSSLLWLVDVVEENATFDVRGLGLSWMNRIANRESERPHEDDRGREHEYPLQDGCVSRASRVIHRHGDTLACLSNSR